MVSIFATLLCLVLITRAAEFTLGNRSRPRYRGGGYGGGCAATLVVIGVGTVLTFIVALITGHIW